MIQICTFKWHKEGYRSKYTHEHVNILYNMLKRSISPTIEWEMVCITDDATGINKDIRIVPLWPNPCPSYAEGQRTRPNCFARLRMFSDEMRDVIGNKFIWMDLDTVIVDNIDNIITDPAPFKMCRIDGEFMPCNGSIVMIEAGARKDIWESFNPSMVHPSTGFLRCENRPVGSDQAWISMKMTEDEKRNTWGQRDGVFSYRCHIRKLGMTQLPPNCKIVLFHGNFEPWMPEIYNKYKWVQGAYR